MLVTEAKDRRFTYGDYVSWLDNERCELIDGRLDLGDIFETVP